MSNIDQNKTGSWYAPLKEERPKEKSGRKTKSVWIGIGVFALVLALIVGSSLAFAGTEPAPPENYVPGGPMPKDWDDFFDEYFDDVQTDVMETNLPRTDYSGEFILELKPQTEEAMTLQQLYESCADSVVAITGTIEGESGFYWGTGVILSEDGLILTNAHIIDGCDSAEITLYDNKNYEAKLVGADAVSDLAVLKIEASGLPCASFGDIGALAVGDRVAAIGNPLGETFRSTLTDGIVSAISRGLSYNGHTMNLLQTNTAINEGNSGGPLFNMHGQVIGITNMKMMSYYSSIEGIGFAIPSTTVKNVVDSLVEYGEVRGRPSIGITVGAVPEDASSYYDIPAGLYISSVSENSDAAEKGVQVGDILTAVNGNPVYTTQDVAAIKETLSVGDTMRLDIWRNGESFSLDIVLMDTNDVY